MQRKNYIHNIRTLILSATLALLGVVNSHAQENVYHSGERIAVENGFDVYIPGSFTTLDTASLPIMNRATIHIQGNLIHNGLGQLFGPNPTEGTLRFYGSPATPSSISGLRPINVHNLIIDLDQPFGTGTLLLKTDSLSAYGDVQFLNGGFFLDTNTFSLVHYASAIGNGIVVESNTARPYSANGKISVKNNPFTVGAITNVKGIGFGFTLDDPLGGTPVLHRTFQTQGAGAISGSIERVFSLDGHSNAATFRAVQIDYLNNSELGLVPPASMGDLRIFSSEDNGQVWRHKGSSAVPGTVNSGSKLTTFSLPPNYTMVTAAVNPCDVLPTVQINQVLTDVIPNDTLLNITQAMSCNPLNVNIALFASGASTTVFEWRNDSLNAANEYTYQTQVSGIPYYAGMLGNYWVIATDIRGCTDSVEVEVVTAPAADPAFTVNGAGYCDGTTVNLTPTDIDQTGSGYIYVWDFGDGNTSTGYNASHTYSTYGSYAVTLTVTTDVNCSASEQHTLIIHPIPTPAFSATPACPGSVVNFDNNSTAGAAAVLVDLTWDFGDGSPTTNSLGNGVGSGGDVAHTYSSEGTYPVTLTATANGCTSPPLNQNITVYPMPVPSFTVTNACEGQTASFTNTSSIASGSMTYIWDFNGGAGPSSMTTNPSYSYSNAATYDIILEATSDQGCVTSITVPVTIYENPAANFSVTNACENNPASFVDVTPTIAGSTPYTYSWTFGDGNTGNQATETNSYTAAGTYTVTMTVTTSNNCVGSATNNVVVYPGPSVSFTALDGCAGSPITFTNTSTNATSYTWTFPSIPTTATTQNTTQTFPNDGTFNVILEATSANGCTDQYNGTITVHPLPTVNLGGTVTTCGTSYILDANPGGVNNGSTFLWSTGATTDNYTATFNGSFSVTVTSPVGCVNSDNVNVTLNSAVIPNLGPNATFCDSTVLDAGYPGSTYSWTPGGSTSQTITTNTSGTYSVTVTDQNGCTGTGSTAVTIVSSSPVNLGNDITACDGDVITLDAGVYTSYLWNDASTNQTLDVTTNGYYYVDILNGAGCESSDTIQVTFENTPFFSLGPDATECDQYLLNGFTPNASFLWSDASTSGTLNVTSSGTYWLEATDLSTSCTYSDTVIVTINALPTVNLGLDTTLCNGGSIVLDAGNPGATYAWNSGQATQTLTVGAQGSYEVTVTDGNGCASDDQIVITVRPDFIIDLGPNSPFCNGSTVILDPNLTTTGNQYAWYDENGLISNNTTYAVEDTGMYYLTVIDNFGCVATDSVEITPSNLSLFPVFLADSEINIGDSLLCVNLSYPKPYDSEWFVSGVSVSTDSIPVLYFPPTPGTYPVTLTVTSQFCQASITKNILVLPNREEVRIEPEVDLFSAIQVMHLYPNPTNGEVSLLVELSAQSDVQIDVFSLSGALIHTERQTFEKNTLTYNFQQHSAGIYVIRLSVNRESKALKFILLPE